MLFGTSLDAKLTAVSGTVDVEAEETSAKTAMRPMIEAPVFPGRPPELAMRPPGQRTVTKFPGRARLSEDLQRGYVLHFFANHELLAIEVMALALLRFPDAPVGFRQGLMRTITEEQEHMRLYLARMKTLGVEFGSLPLNAFFWNCMRTMKSPQEYVAAMSLTFEQANLDFALHYADLFQEIGDHETAAILQRVCADEIGHVKHGVVWLDRWREKSESLWDAYVRSLEFPMSPARAKGLDFYREPRRAAGLPEDFIDRLDLYAQSKGRPARVWWFNPDAETEVADAMSGVDAVAGGRPPSGSSRNLHNLRRELAPLLMFVASRDDLVIVPEVPGDAHRAELKRCGFSVPELFAESPGSIFEQERQQAGRRYGAFVPWGSTQRAEIEAAKWNCSVTPHNPDVWSKEFALSVDRHWRASSHNVPKSVEVGAICRDASSLRTALAEIAAAGFTEALCKLPRASSGRGHLRVDLAAVLDGPQMPTVPSRQVARSMREIEDFLARQGALVVEPWFERVVDFSTQIEVSPDSPIKIVGVTRLLNTRHGVWKGHVIGKLFADLSENSLRALHGNQAAGRSMLEIASDAARFAGDCLRETGFTGAAGIDAFVARGRVDGELLLRPIVEINPRFTMGRIAVEIERKIAPGRVAVWRRIDRRECQRAGFGELAELAAELRRVFPAECVQHGRVTVVAGGAILLGDPKLAVLGIDVLVVGRSLSEMEKMIRDQFRVELIPDAIRSSVHATS